jgi:hypothetical protein
VHDVPENRPAADFDHRLWLQHGFFGEARSEATSQNDGLHKTKPSTGNPGPAPACQLAVLAQGRHVEQSKDPASICHVND